MTNATPEDQIAAVESWAERLTTTCDGCTMSWRHWRARGPAGHRPLVLLHGGSGSWRHWIRNIDAFAGDRDVWAPDLPGFGESDRPPSPGNFASVAHVVASGLRDLLPADTMIDLAGFSFGAHTSQYVAADLGPRVATTVLVTAHLLGPLLWQPGDNLERWRDVSDPGERVRILKRNLGVLMLAHEESKDALAVHIYATDLLRSRLHPGKFINDRDFTMIERLPCRIAAIAGALDPLGVPSPAAQGDLLMKQRPDARFCLVPNVGHWILYEAPDVLNAQLRTYLDT